MLTEINNIFYHYFVDEQNRKQGKYLERHTGGQPWVTAFYTDDERNGLCTWYYTDGKKWEQCVYVHGMINDEYRHWDEKGLLSDHCFMIDNKKIPFSEIPYPTTNEELMLFKLKYDLQLIDKNVC